MRFYNQQHKNYCGIDLHARKMYVCIIDQKGKMKVHQNIKTDPELLFEVVFPFLDDIVIGVECVFCWYWISDLCAEHKIPFVLGHALYMKVIHGGKTKNDKIDSYKIAALLRGGNFPIARTRIRLKCVLPGICCAAACILPAAAVNWSPIFKIQTPSITCLHSLKKFHVNITAKE